MHIKKVKSSISASNAFCISTATNFNYFSIADLDQVRLFYPQFFIYLLEKLVQLLVSSYVSSIIKRPVNSSFIMLLRMQNTRDHALCNYSRAQIIDDQAHYCINPLNAEFINFVNCQNIIINRHVSRILLFDYMTEIKIIISCIAEEDIVVEIYSLLR